MEFNLECVSQNGHCRLEEGCICFTQVPEMFNIFPDIIRTIFAENCVAVVFLAAILMNLIMPKDSEA